MPVLPNYYVSHEWLRELRRRGRPPRVAVDFVVPDEEPVLVGHYTRAHDEMTAAQASALIMRAEDPLGYEVVLPRVVTHPLRSEVRVRCPRSSDGDTGQRRVAAARAHVLYAGAGIPASKVRASYDHLYEL